MAFGIIGSTEYGFSKKKNEKKEKKIALSVRYFWSGERKNCHAVRDKKRYIYIKKPQKETKGKFGGD